MLHCTAQDDQVAMRDGPWPSAYFRGAFPFFTQVTSFFICIDVQYEHDMAVEKMINSQVNFDCHVACTSIPIADS